MIDAHSAPVQLNPVPEELKGTTLKAGRPTVIGSALSLVMILVLAACNFDMRGEPVTRPYAEATPQGGAASPASTRSVDAATARFVEAMPGETIRAIAQRLQIDPDLLARTNSIDPDQPLTTGRIVILPRSTPASPSGNIAELAESAIEAAESATGGIGSTGNVRQHVVREGDTLPGLARFYGVTESKIAAANNLVGSPVLQVGQILSIPAPSVTIAPSKPLQAVTVVEEELPAPPSADDPLPETQEVAELPESPEMRTQRSRSTESAFMMPVSGEITRPYTGRGGYEGIRIAAPEGTEVHAAGDGEVALVSRNPDGTSVLLIRHDNNVFTVYADLTGIDLQTGTTVSRGQPIGKIPGGDKQFLHFELRLGTESTDPVPYLS